jgi:hypothetical protein
MGRRAAAVLVAFLALACSSSQPADEDADARQLLAVVVHAMGAVGSSANFKVSIANVSSETLTIKSVTVNPGVQRQAMAGIPVTTPFTLEPGMERTVIGEMRVYQGDPDWPDIVAIDIAWDRNGKHEGYTWRLDVLGARQR